MNIMFLLIGVSLLAAMVFLFLFIWAVKSGQFDDIFTPSVRILFDDDLDSKDETKKEAKGNEEPAEPGNEENKKN
jgi:cbb3-type cytochrome oxidase maturation protein